MKCVVVGAHVMVLEMLCSMLRMLLGFDIVGSGRGLQDAARLASLPRIDVLIFDAFIGETSSIQLIRSLLLSHPHMECILLTDGRDLGPLPDDVARHVVAVVAKTASLGEMFSIMTSALRCQATGRPIIPTATHLRSLLTKREYELLDALGRGLSNKEVAASLDISVRTVETHRKAISKKLGCNGASLVRVAVLASLTALERTAGSARARDLAG